MVSKAVLTAGNPEGDVMFGVDNTFLSRVVDADVFEPYEAAGLDAVPDELRALVPDGEATPVDFGDVCVNYDMAWFAEHDLEPPADLAALADPAYADLLVVENPATSSPGLAFLMATIAEFGEDGWRRLLAPPARQRRGGRRRLDRGVLRALLRRRRRAASRSSSATARARRPRWCSPTRRSTRRRPAVVDTTCFRQVEFAGVLRGTDHPTRPGSWSTSCCRRAFQAELPLNLFVYPANTDVPLPAVFTTTPRVPADPPTLDPATITADREAWIDEWTDTVLR